MKNVLVINKKREYYEQCGSQNEKYTPYNENFAEDKGINGQFNEKGIFQN